MPVAFSSEERARITAQLLETGYTLFTRQGLRKTSLDELVAPAGVAKSSFYQFFPSKEALYLELMLREAGSVKRRVVDEALDTTGDPGEALRRFLRATLDELATNPLWRRLTTHPDEMQAVARKLDPDHVSATADNPAAALTEFVIRKQRDGELINTGLAADPAVVVGVLQTVLLVPLYAERLGDPALCSRILDLLIDIITAGLTTHRN